MPQPRVLPFLLAVLAGFLVTSCKEPPTASPAPPPLPTPPVSYNFEVRPILARHCFACHGRDQKAPRSGLRLDDPQFAFDPLDDLPDQSDRHALVPGDRQRSVAWQLLTSDAPPAPPHDHLALRDQEMEIIGRWIEEGARYEPHWAFQPLPAKVPLPPVSNPDWASQPLDRFVLAALERAGVRPAPEADPRSILRRLTLALTGLPPTPENLSSFQPATLKSRVDQLLASSAFGQHFASFWLEAARYADPLSPGSELPSTRWVYRDWVVSAFNQNMPIDRFLTAQLAGDLDQGSDSDLIVATAFNRLHPLHDDPEVTPEDALAANAAARVQNLGSTLLGLTLECAQCHDHKSDPISRDEFAALAGFFRTIPENGLHLHPDLVPGPTHAILSNQQAETIVRAQDQVTQLENSLTAARPTAEDQFQAWLADPLATPVINDTLAIFTFDNRSPESPNRALTGTGSLQLENPKFTKGFSGHAISFDGTTHLTLPDSFSTTQSEPWSFTLRARTAAQQPAPRLLLARAVGPDSAPRGFELLLADGHLIARLTREWPGNAIAIRTTAPVVAPGHWALITWTYDGSSSAGGLALHVDGQAVETEILADSLWKPALPADAISLPWQLGGRPDAAGFSGGAIDELQYHARALTPVEIATLYDGRSLGVTFADSARHLPALRSFYFSSLHPETRTLRQHIAAARDERLAAESELLEVSVMKDAPSDDFADRGLPAILPQPEPRRPLTRLALASSLVEPDHPLTARVFVNRIWQHFFGRGLVATPDNFGLLGAAPSHPELLDWLARDFVSHGWDLKRLCRQIALSATFRQESAERPELADRDAGRGLLTRGPAIPLSAPEFRDLVLHTAGLINSPSSVAGHLHYVRSLYTHHLAAEFRPLRPAGEAPNSSSCRIDHTRPRPQPTPPTLTEAELHAASGPIASRLLREASDDRDRLNALFHLLHGRPMTPREATELPAWVAAARAKVTADHPAPLPQSQPAPGPIDPELDRSEFALWSLVVRDLLGLNQGTR